MLIIVLPRSFHGKTISKTKQEKRQRKMRDELEARKAATGEGSANAFARLAGSHVAGTPYTVISGNVQPGQSSDPASGFATVDHARVPPPLLPCVAMKHLCYLLPPKEQING